MGLIGWLRQKVGTQDEVFLEIPFEDTPGRLFVSPMPYGPYDKYNQVMRRYRDAQVQFAVPLVTDDEIQRKAKKDLLGLYQEYGIDVIRFPIRDLTSPELEKVVELVKTIAPYLRAGAGIAVHCNAGTGRTAVIVACLASELLDLSGPEATGYVTSRMQTQLTASQIRVVQRFADQRRPA